MYRYNIVGLCFDISCNDPDIINEINQKYLVFSCKSQPDIFAEFIFNEGVDRSGYKVNCVASNNDRNLRFDIECGIGEARAFIIENLLHFIFRHAVQVDGTSRYLVHACGVEHDGLGYVFIAPSGGGKSTLASLLIRGNSTLNLLSDEMVGVSEMNGIIYAHSTPLRPTIDVKRDICVPLKAIYIIRKGTTNSVTSVSKEILFDNLFCQFEPRFGIANLLPFSLKDQFNMVVSLLNKVAGFELTFIKDISPWPQINIGEERIKENERHIGKIEVLG